MGGLCQTRHGLSTQSDKEALFKDEGLIPAHPAVVEKSGAKRGGPDLCSQPHRRIFFHMHVSLVARFLHYSAGLPWTIPSAAILQPSSEFTYSSDGLGWSMSNRDPSIIQLDRLSHPRSLIRNLPLHLSPFNYTPLCLCIIVVTLSCLQRSCQ